MIEAPAETRITFRLLQVHSTNVLISSNTSDEHIACVDHVSGGILHRKLAKLAEIYTFSYQLSIPFCERELAVQMVQRF